MQKIIYYLFVLLLMLTFNESIIAQGVDPGTDNLTHSWTFEDGTADDNVGGLEGTLMGGADVFDGSLFLGELDSWVELPAPDIAINTYDEVTLEAWFASFAGSNTGYHMIVFFGTTVNTLGNDYYFITPARGDDISRAAISVGVEASPWTGESGANGPEYDDGEIHHMVSTLNATDITLYIDGELQTTTPLDTNNSIAGISTDFAYLAKGGYEADPTWQGEILEFNIYNKALSAEEILFLFQRGGTPTSVEEESSTIPGAYSLSQNYPNPFNPTTLITFNIPNNDHVSLKVFDILGKEVTTIVDNDLRAGEHKVEWNAAHLVSGIYFYKLTAGNYTETKKMMLLK